ncbi:MAG TPA: response regulator [Ramlibacter sp.]|nr:response regulator [Ramlibacter sp.]
MSHPAEAARFKILIAEDSRTQAERLRYILEQDNYEVSVAGNGRVALEAMSSFQPDIVISDVNMPEMNGYELSRRIKADPALRDIPVILVTTMSEPEDVIRGLECGADNFMLKPYDVRYMLGRVRYALVNREAHADDPALGVRIVFNGERHFITADRLQILNLLLSTYEAAIQRNKELVHSKETLVSRSTEIGMANRFLDSVIENIPHMMFVKSADDLRFVRVNQAFEALTGFSRNDVLGKSDRDFFPPEQAEQFIDKDRVVLANGACDAFDEQIQTRHRGVRTLRTRKIALHDEHRQPRFLLGISDDVTEKIARENEILRLNEELAQSMAAADAANRAKTTFLATMSHEIRTPMNGMLGMLELLSLSKLDDEQRSTLAIVRESSASLLRIVDDILDFSKIEAGQLEIVPEVASARQILDEVVRMYSGAAASKGLSFTTHLDEEISPAVWVDPLRLRQILGNFVSNALKFTSRGSIDIEARRVGHAGDTEDIRFIVRDTGIGISVDNQRKLFQPFSQGNAQAARRAGGTGLGLSICRRLSEMMGGAIEMDSKLGHGTTMSFTLPVRIAAREEALRVKTERPSEGDALLAQPRPAPAVAQAEAERTLVLLVDDHPTNRALLLRQLNVLGYAAQAAEDGHAALAQWRTGRYALVITDCEMPGLDGYELARSIRMIEADGGAARTPIIAFTAHALAGEADKCFLAGMDDCLTKPVDLRSLRTKLDRWLPIPTTRVHPASSPDAALATAELPPLDLSLLAEACGDDASASIEMLEFFQRTNLDDAAQLRQAITAQDLGRMRRSSHRMIGAGRMLGAHDFVNACEHINRASHTGDMDAVNAGLDEFERQMSRLSECVDGLRSQHEQGGPLVV